VDQSDLILYGASNNTTREILSCSDLFSLLDEMAKLYANQLIQ
jgi:hypothetical protein